MTEGARAFPRHLSALVDSYLETVDWGLHAQELAGFDEALAHPLRAGGKRLRPLLVLATVEALGGDVEAALPTAAALELVHTFSLVHDDLPALDDDDLRRGLPTTHVRYGEDVAILVGDALQNTAFGLIAELQQGPAERRLAVLATLARAVDGMIRGQYLDLRMAVEPDVEALRRMCSLKTGCLIAASVDCATALVGAGPAESAAYRAFAAELGVGFQIVDDVLDATESSETLGKPAGSDERGGKRTYVTVLGLERAQELAAASERSVEALGAALPGSPAALRAIAERVFRRTS